MFCYQKALGIILFILSCNQMPAQVLDQSWKEIVHKSKEEWFATPDAITIAENVLLYQRNIGGWPKNVQIHKPLNETEKTKLLNLKTKTEGCTTDNGATVLEMIFLSKIYKQVPEERYKEAFLSGLNYLLEAQYKNGGWPQFYPLKEGYYSHITYNDNSMVNILNVFKEIIYKTGYFSIKPSEKVIERLQTAFNKGVDCILKTQYKQNGELTAWCAQHDEITLLPAKARAYELPSLSGGESAGIVILLMSIKDPSPEIINAVNKAVNWFEKTKISGLKEVRHYADDGRLKEKVMVQDPDAKPLWARFMELQDNRPFFCDRDGIKKYSMAEIGEERRNGYAWYIDKPIKVLTKYDDWKKKHAIEKSNKKPANEYKMTVAKDGSGDYVNIQDAINNAKSFPYRRVEIFIKNGVYNEKVKIHEWNTYISLIGESKEKTIIFYDDHFKKIDKGRNSTFLTYTVLVEGNDFTAKNLTIQNTAGDVGQAIALSVNADRCYIKNCNILGNQDTLYTSGEGFRQYFSNCYIEGTTDFIFGQATVLFEECIIHSKRNSYITAASTPESIPYGFVFMNCNLTADENVTEVYLGRPWRIYAKTVFLECKMGEHIKPEGWHSWSKPEAEKTTYYGEYNSNGKGSKPDKRVLWSHQLSKSEAKKYTVTRILGMNPEMLNEKWYVNFSSKKK